MALNLDGQEDSIPFVNSTRGVSGLRHQKAVILDFRMYGGEVYPHPSI